MDWIELHLIVAAEQVQRAEQALLEAGASAITLTDSADHPLLEPAPGETPLWPQLRLTGLFGNDCVASDAITRLNDALADLSCEVSATRLADREWERAWLEHYGPMQFGKTLWVCPPDLEAKIRSDAGQDAIIVRMDPGLAFGTGTHPTTALCLEALEANPPVHQSVVDFGCGSGILGIAALKLGAREVHAVDIDPQALTASEDNARRNGVAAGLKTYADADRVAPEADLLLANIVARPLLQLAPRLARLVRPGGRLVLSGLLAHQADAVAARYARDFHVDTMEQRDDWCLIGATRTVDRG